MKHLLRGLERHGIGSRALSEDDFWRICGEEDIEVFWSRKRFPFYFTVPDDDLRVIVLPDRLRGIKLVFSMFHELGHHLLHGGDEPCIAFQGLSDSKYEAEADAVALVSLMPKDVMYELTGEEIELIGHKQWRDRERLHFFYDM